MGKRSKRGANLRAKKRANETHQELEETLIEQSETKRVQSKTDDELFILDTDRKESAASAKAASDRRKSDKEASRKRKLEYSDKEKRQIRKMIEVHGKDGVVALAEEGRARLEKKKMQKQKELSAAAKKPTFDLWGEPSATSSASAKVDKKRKSTTTTHQPPPAQPMQSNLSKKQIKARKQAQRNAPPQLAVEVAHPGQSYKPDKEQHQDAIGEALSIEIRRNEAEEYKSKPISEGMTAFTKEFIVDSDSEEEDSSDDEEEEDTNNNKAKIIKRKEKLTRAQRNKQKRVKAELTAIKERKAHKQFLHQANEVHVHNKSIKKTEQQQRERQIELSKLKMEKKSKPLGKDVWSALSQKDPIRAPALPVTLTEELSGGGKEVDGVAAAAGGGLRTVKPKGSLVTDRVESMVARNMISKKREGRRVVQGKRRPKTRGAQGTEYLLV